MHKKFSLLIFLILFPFFCIAKEKISATLQFPQKIKADKEFEVLVKISGLKEGKYDLKLTLKKEKEISEIYDSTNKKWQSSLYYLKEEVFGPNFEKNYKMRIKENYFDTEGKAQLILRLKQKGKIIFDKKEEVEIEKGEKSNFQPKDFLPRKNLDFKKELDSDFFEKIARFENKSILMLGFFVFLIVLTFLIKNQIKK
jgi:hypothetical protein